MRINENFNFKALYDSQEHEVDGLFGDSPFDQIITECDYYDPKEFSEFSEELGKCMSYLHLHCRSLCDLYSEDTFSSNVVGMSEVYRCERDSRLAWISRLLVLFADQIHSLGPMLTFSHRRYLI